MMGSRFDNKEASPFKEFDVSGFEVHPSQLETARSIFERHPNIASEFPKNQYERSFYMGVLLNLTEAMMSQATHNVSKGDLSDANAVLALLKWLEEKLEEPSESKEIAETCSNHIQPRSRQVCKSSISVCQIIN